MKKKNIVTIGGGTGSYVLLQGLKKHKLNITAVVTVADSGGSTGRLRSEFGFLPVGDIRQCIAALADEGEEEYVRKLLLYRFSKGKGLKGHNLGNLILTALQDMTGSEQKAIAIASRIFQLQGKVLPISLKNIDLVAEYNDGTRLIGEHKIDEPKFGGGKEIINLTTKPKAEIYLKTKKAIENADLIVLGPGDLYTSILPNLVINGAKKTINNSRAEIVYIVNLMTRYSQTPGFTAKKHVEEIKKYLDKYPDYIFINTKKIPVDFLEKYKKQQSVPVKDDLDNHDFMVIRGAFLKNEIVKKKKGDSLQRSFLRHDSNKLADKIVGIIKE